MWSTAPLQPNCGVQYSGIAEVINILRSTAELQKTATYSGVQQHTVRRTVALRKIEHLQKAATFRGQDILKRALRRTVDFAEAKNQRTGVFQEAA